MVDYKALDQEIISKIDIRAEYERLGLKFRASRPNEKGWIACNAMGKDQRSPSAGVHSKTAHYHDFKTGEHLSFWDFCSKYHHGQFPTFQSARNHWAAQTGVPMPAKKKGPVNEFVFTQWSEAAAHIFCRRKPGITVAGLRRAGARFARWPANAPLHESFSVLAFPCFAPGNAAPVRWVFLNTTGGYLSIFQGKGKKRIPSKVCCSSGGNAGFLQAGQGERVIKVEGVSDWLAVLSQDAWNPAEYRVVSNSGGATEIPRKEWRSIFLDADSIVVGDCDKVGIDGAALWSKFAAPLSRSLKNPILPFPVTASSGKDLRDYFNEGHSLTDFLALADAAPDLHSVAPAPQNGDMALVTDSLRNTLKIEVLGERSDGTIEVFGIETRKTFGIRDIERFKYANLLQFAGKPAQDHVYDGRGEAPANMFSMSAVRQHIALAASGKRFTSRSHLGVGCWRISRSGPIVLVDSGEGATYSKQGGLCVHQSPQIEGCVLDFASGESWCDFGVLKFILASMSHERALEAYKEVRDVFRCWNWRLDSTSDILAALVPCTFLQTLWEWRPHIAITGGSNAGKSTLFDYVLRNLFGGLSLLCGGDVTEAGIRQQVRNSAVVILLDEFEMNPHRKRILDVLRNSSRGSVTFRGTPNQQGLAFTLKHMTWFAAIESGLKREADRNRFIILELIRIDPKLHGKLNLPSPKALADLGMKLLAAALFASEQIFDLAASLRSIQVKDVHPRLVEAYAVPAAMLAAFNKSNPKDAEEILRWMLEGRVTDLIASRDENDLVHDILGSQFFVGGGRKLVVAEVITDPEMRHIHRKDLEREGIALINNRPGPRRPTAEPDAIFFAYHTIQRQLLKGTDWADKQKALKEVLIRLPGAEHVQRSVMGDKVWGIEVPATSVLAKIEPETDDLEIPNEERTSDPGS
jgi:hypothetical protein